MPDLTTTVTVSEAEPKAPEKPPSKRSKTWKRRVVLRRVRQVETWLRGRWPAPLPTTVLISPPKRFSDPNDLGHTIIERGTQLIELLVDRPLEETVDTLLHEWAHALTLVFTRPGESTHRDEYWLAYGRIYRDYFERGGAELSEDITP